MNPIAFVIGIRNDVNSISFMAYLPNLCEVLVRSTSGPEIFYSYNKSGKKGGYNLPAKSQLRFWLTLFIEMHIFVSMKYCSFREQCIIRNFSAIFAEE